MIKFTIKSPNILQTRRPAVKELLKSSFGIFHYNYFQNKKRFSILSLNKTFKFFFIICGIIVVFQKIYSLYLLKMSHSRSLKKLFFDATTWWRWFGGANFEMCICSKISLWIGKIFAIFSKSLKEAIWSNLKHRHLVVGPTIFSAKNLFH